jgi:hypothetical protein
VTIAGEKQSFECALIWFQNRKAPLFVRGEQTPPSTPEVYRQLKGMLAYFGNPELFSAEYCRVFQLVIAWDCYRGLACLTNSDKWKR